MAFVRARPSVIGGGDVGDDSHATSCLHVEWADLRAAAAAAEESSASDRV